MNKKRIISILLLLAMVFTMLPATVFAKDSDFKVNSSGVLTGYSGLGGNVVIPSIVNGISVTGIGNSAFKDKYNVTGIVIPNGVTTIGDRAFFECYNLQNITIPATVSSIGAYAFYGCECLTSIKLPLGIDKINDYTFGNCKGLMTIRIPSGVTSIGISAFFECVELYRVWLPVSLKRIQQSAFSSLCSALYDGDVYYSGTKTQWNSILIGNDNDSLNYATIHYSVPDITVQPDDKTMIAGKTARFSVEAVGGNLSYQWQVSKDGGKTWTNSVLSTARNRTLEVYAHQSFNGYRYRCKVKNTNGIRTSQSAKLTVRWKPVITTQPTAKTVAAGKYTGFSVKAEGGGLRYQWQVSKDGGKTWSNSVYSSATKSTIYFKSYKMFSGYLYRCVVKNIAGSTTTKVVRLTVS